MIKPFLRSKNYISQLAQIHGPDRIIKAMFMSFNDADRVVTPRHYGITKRYYYRDNMETLLDKNFSNDD